MTELSSLKMYPNPLNNDVLFVFYVNWIITSCVCLEKIIQQRVSKTLPKALGEPGRPRGLPIVFLIFNISDAVRTTRQLWISCWDCAVAPADLRFRCLYRVHSKGHFSRVKFNAISCCSNQKLARSNEMEDLFVYEQRRFRPACEAETLLFCVKLLYNGFKVEWADTPRRPSVWSTITQFVVAFIVTSYWATYRFIEACVNWFGCINTCKSAGPQHFL